ncbi:MAG TPA: substrate-binding domain-containing protein [Candidatus Acidoferrales bacterium]|nr:substrate-binding domain-containing protein [Candidatus Acidoferrales bacterium]
MKKLNILVSLTTNDNDYQIEQGAAAEEAARRLGVSVRIVFAENDPFKQSEQLLEAVQAAAENRPDAIVFEPVGGTALPQVGRAAVAAGIGWVILNREAENLAEFRRTAKAPVFCISSNHVEIGKMQGQQLGALLPNGGTALYIQGPSENSAAKQRTLGMQQTKPENVKTVMLKGQWTEESAYKAVKSWMKLSTSQKLPIEVVCAQDDSMALGARKALQEQADETVRERWLSLPFTGCDGLPKTGQEFVRRGLLAATVVVPPNTTLALEVLAKAVAQGTQPPEVTLTVPTSLPKIEELAAKQAPKSRVLVPR